MLPKKQFELIALSFFWLSVRLGVDTRVVFKKSGFGGCSPGTKTGRRAHSDVPPERKTERGYVRMFPQNENRSEGRLAKTTLLRNRPLSPLEL